ncbi:DUF2249 domain-containing protein [Cellulomonas sp. P22]|uniref:DUF2249 domain-containing protein n=1 Tax=Cellulomonas sp. P22 TaxID=3373189 RepID=UPI0037913EEC
MNAVTLATSAADSAAATTIEQHHAEMAGALALLVETLVGAAVARDQVAVQAARTGLVTWCETELLPHARAEEAEMYPPARELREGRLLIDGMRGEHEALNGLVARLATTADPVRAAADATALRVLFESHLLKENTLVVPLLVAAPGVALATILDAMHHELTAHVTEPVPDVEDAPAGGCGGECGCGGSDEPELPVLDARTVPHALRHATIFGALDAVGPGSGMVLVAPHDPLPLLAQIEQRQPGAFAVDYLERGPEAWRLRLVRSAV